MKSRGGRSRVNGYGRPWRDGLPVETGDLERDGHTRHQILMALNCGGPRWSGSLSPPHPHMYGIKGVGYHPIETSHKVFRTVSRGFPVATLTELFRRK